MCASLTKIAPGSGLLGLAVPRRSDIVPHLMDFAVQGKPDSGNSSSGPIRDVVIERVVSSKRALETRRSRLRNKRRCLNRGL